MNLNNALFFGGSSEIAIELSKILKKKYRIVSFSRKKTNCKSYFKEAKLNFESNRIQTNILNKNSPKKIKLVIFFQATQPNYEDFSKLSNTFINRVLNVNCITSIKIAYYLIKSKHLSSDCKIIFFSSRSGSISERGELSFHKPGGNNLYRASKTILNSFVKNLAFEFHSKNYIFLAYHPGWVKTKSSGGKDLSKSKASRFFVKILKKIKKKNSGSFLNYNYQKIKW